MNHRCAKGVSRWKFNLYQTLLVITILTVPFSTTMAGSKKDTLEEYNVKAAYLYNFIRFTKWPAVDSTTNQSPITIGIIGDSPFKKNVFDAVENIVIPGKNRKLAIKYMGKFNHELDLNQCSVVFISTSEKKNISKIINKIGDKPILTVADIKGFATHGGMVNLVIIDQKVRWEMNVSAIRNSSLAVNSQLYKSAVNVINAEDIR